MYMCKYVQICANMSKYVQICANMSKYVQICACAHTLAKGAFQDVRGRKRNMHLLDPTYSYKHLYMSIHVYTYMHTMYK